MLVTFRELNRPPIYIKSKIPMPECHGKYQTPGVQLRFSSKKEVPRGNTIWLKLFTNLFE